MDDVPIRNADGNVQRVAAHEDPTTPGRVTQRQLVQHMVDGDPVDVSTTDPLPVAGEVSIDGTVPVSGPLTDDQLRDSPVDVAVTGTVPVTHTGSSAPLTNAQLRAAAVPVDTELPTAAVPGDTDGNTAAPVVIARPQTYSAAGWRMLRSSSGAALGARDPLAAGLHLHDPASFQARPAASANNVTDADFGGSFGATAMMIWNGTAFARDSIGSVTPTVLLTSAARTVQTGLPTQIAPTRCSRAVIMIDVTASNPTGYLELRVLAYTGAILAGLRIPAGAAAGPYSLALGSAMVIGSPVIAGSAVVQTPGTYVTAHTPAPVPRNTAYSYVMPQTAGQSWTYSASILYLV